MGTALAPFMEGLLLFAAAGTLALPRAWLYVAVSFAGMFGNAAIVAVANPELMNRRGSWKKRKDTRPWDKRLLMTYGLFGFYVLPAVAGLDVGRHPRLSLGAWAAVVGTLLFGFGSVLLTWAMLVNTHFEATVRIQTDRNHRVITTGPYAVVRHPGYLGASLWLLGSPLILGSDLALIPAAIAIAALVARTCLEDHMLRHELPGYAEYTRQVRYRLLPYLW
jgi:protein-S-isoprenylcysteine O-methyltransferase Ste14